MAVAYSQEDLYFNEETFIQPADHSKPAVNVSIRGVTHLRFGVRMAK